MDSGGSATHGHSKLENPHTLTWRGKLNRHPFCGCQLLGQQWLDRTACWAAACGAGLGLPIPWHIARGGRWGGVAGRLAGLLAVPRRLKRPCNTCIALPCNCITFPHSFGLIHPHMRHRQPHTFQQAPPATSPMRDMLLRLLRLVTHQSCQDSCDGLGCYFTSPWRVLGAADSGSPGLLDGIHMHWQW